MRVVPLDAAEVVLHEAHDAASLSAGFAAPTLVLVDRPDAEFARAALAAGAGGVVAASADRDELLSAIDAMRAGLLVLDPGARDALAPAAVRATHALAGDLTNTVKAHVAAIFGKLGATTRTEAVTIALRRGLVML